MFTLCYYAALMLLLNVYYANIMLLLLFAGCTRNGPLNRSKIIFRSDLIQLCV